MTVPEKPGRLWVAIHLGLLVAAAAALAWVNRDQWFFGDEWEFLANRGLLGARLPLWEPHNEHWSTLPILAYTMLRDTVGLGTYWPFVAVLVAVHLTLTHLLWRVMLRSGVLPAVATAAAAVFSMLGSGAENLLWAFQIGFIGSVAFGWAAVLLVVTPGRRPARRDLWAVLLLVGSLMCSGIGVPMVVVAVAAVWMSSRALLRPLVVGGLPAAVFLAWYLAVGRSAPRPGTGERGLREVLGLLGRGLGAVTRGALGTPLLVTAVLLLALALWCVWTAVGIARGRREGDVRVPPLAGLAGAGVFAVMVALGRGSLDSSRYVYVFTAMALPAVAAGLTVLSRWRWAQVVVVVALGAVGVHNVALLRAAAVKEAERETWNREVIQSAGVLVTGGTAAIGPMPEPVHDPDLTTSALRTLVERHGLPAAMTERGSLGARLFLQVVAVPPGTGPASTPATSRDVDGLEETDALPGCLALDADRGQVALETDGHVRSVWLVGDGASYDVLLGTGESAPPARLVTVPDNQVVELLWNLPRGTPSLIVRPRSATSLVCLEAP